MKFLPKCGCTANETERPLRISRALFVGLEDSYNSVKKLQSRELGSTINKNVQHWKISTSYNNLTQIYAVKKLWYLGLPRMIYPSLLRMRSLLNSLPQDSLISGALWIFFEIDAPEYIQSHIKAIFVSLLIVLLETDHPTIEVHFAAIEFMRRTQLTRSADRYISEAKALIWNRQPAQLSHIIIRCLAYKGLDSLVPPSAVLPPMKLTMTVSNARIGQLDQTYFTTLSPGGGLIPINQSVNATDEIIFSLYMRSDLVCRFQTIGFALINPERGPLKLFSDDLSDFELFQTVDSNFFVEVFAECLQWMMQSEGGGTSLAHGTNLTDGNTMDDSEAILNVASRLQPQSGVQLSMEEKYTIVISALPTYAFRPLEKQNGESDEEYTLRTQCEICLCDYEEGDQLRALPCMHAFHASCTENWLRVRLQCPNCLADMVQLLSNPAESPSDSPRPEQ
jgi:hypothetical protein